MKKIRFSANFHETDAGGNSVIRFAAGQDYPADDAEAIRCVARGIAKEVEVEDEAPADPAPESGTAAEGEAAAPAPSEAPATAPAPAAGRAKRQ